MAAKRELVVDVRAALSDAGTIREVKMFGGTAFLLNGNMVAAASPRGLLLRVGKEGTMQPLDDKGSVRW